jgi:hypothetical protein
MDMSKTPTPKANKLDNDSNVSVTRSQLANRQGNGPEGVSLGYGAAEKAKNDIINHNAKTKSAADSALAEAQRAMGLK